MIVYIFLHLMTFDLILLALIMIFSFGQHANTKRGHVLCANFVKYLQQNALKFVFYNYLLIFALGDLSPHLLALIMIFHLGNRQKLKEGMPLGYLSIVAFHAAKVPQMCFSTLICS